MMIKPVDAEARATRYIESILNDPFCWGKNHCTAIALGVIDAIYETNHLDWHKETHNVDSRERALELSEQRATIDMFNDVGYRQVKSISCGDVLYCIKDDLECLHVYVQGYFICAVEDDVVTMIPPKHIYHYLKRNNIEYSIWSCHQ